MEEIVSPSCSVGARKYFASSWATLSGLGAFDLLLRFAGQRYDAETGLYYNYFRDYDPSIGRYAQSDPMGFAGSLNTYTYVVANPIGLVDALGNIPHMPGLQAPNLSGDDADLPPSDSGDAGKTTSGSCPPESSCKTIIDIETGYPPYCPAGCFRRAGRVTVLTCSPYVRQIKPGCFCSATIGVKG